MHRHTLLGGGQRAHTPCHISCVQVATYRHGVRESHVWHRHGAHTTTPHSDPPHSDPPHSDPPHSDLHTVTRWWQLRVSLVLSDTRQGTGTLTVAVVCQHSIIIGKVVVRPDGLYNGTFICSHLVQFACSCLNDTPTWLPHHAHWSMLVQWTVDWCALHTRVTSRQDLYVQLTLSVSWSGIVMHLAHSPCNVPLQSVWCCYYNNESETTHV